MLDMEFTSEFPLNRSDSRASTPPLFFTASTPSGRALQDLHESKPPSSSSVQYSTVQCSGVQCSTVLYCTVRGRVHRVPCAPTLISCAALKGEQAQVKATTHHLNDLQSEAGGLGGR